MNHRGVSPVVGMVLLVGLTSVVAVGILAVGLSITDATSSAAEARQVQSSMEQLADKGERVSDGEVNTESFTLSGTDSGTASVDPDAGRLVITHNTSSDTEELYNDSLGAYRYETDGTTFAYQGGGVWRAEEHGKPQMVTPPAFEYRSGEASNQEPTLAFPIMRVTGSAVGNGAVDGELSAQSRREIYPSNASHNNPLEGGQVNISIASDYCEGWESHIRDRTDALVIDSCQSTAKTAAGQLRATLTVDTRGTIQAAAIATKTVGQPAGGEGDVNGHVVVPGGASAIGPDLNYDSVEDRSITLPPSGVDAEKAKCGGSFGNPPNDITTGGLYCFDKIINDNITITPDGGPVTIVVRDRITFNANEKGITVKNNTGPNNDVKIYSGGPVNYQSNQPFGNADDPSQTELRSDHRILIQGDNAAVYGFVLSTGNDTSDKAIEIDGSASLTGTAFAPEILVQGDASKIHSHNSMKKVGGKVPENDYYLHVSETILQVRD